MRTLLKRFIKSCIGLSTPNQYVNIIKTIIFNYKILGIKGVLVRPVIIYSNTNIYKIGEIKFNTELKKGLVTIGKLDFKSQGITKFSNNGTINIDGPVHIEGCTILENYGNIIFRGYNRIGDGCKIFIRESLDFGKHSRLGFNSTIMDSDDHFVIDVETHIVNRFTKPIFIGKYNFFGNSTFIKKGTKTPDCLIVASPFAMLSKDYTSLPNYSVIGGCPAKVIKSGIRRIFNEFEEKKLVEYFKSNPEKNQTVVDIKDSELEQFCMNSQVF